MSEPLPTKINWRSTPWGMLPPLERVEYPATVERRRTCGDCLGLGKTVKLIDCPTCKGGGYERHA